MKTASHGFPLDAIRFLLDMPATVAAWVVGTALFFFAVAGLLAYVNSRPRSGAARRAGHTEHGGGVLHRLWRLRQRRIAREARNRELRRYAEEVAVAAGRAADTAKRRRAEWLAAQEAMSASLLLFEAAEEEVRRAGAAARYGTSSAPDTPAEYAYRERHLHRITMTAFWRGILPAEELCNVLARRNGWHPHLPPVEQELLLRRAIRDHLRRQYDAARQRERTAWLDAELARASARSLREEAFAAAAQLAEVEHRTAPTWVRQWRSALRSPALGSLAIRLPALRLPTLRLPAPRPLAPRLLAALASTRWAVRRQAARWRTVRAGWQPDAEHVTRW